MHRFNAFSRNVNTINWKNLSTHGGIYKLEKIQQAFCSGERQNPKEFKEIWKDVFLRLILTDGTSEKGCAKIEYWGFFVHFVFEFQANSIYTLHLCFS